MATGIPARLSAAEGRKFAFTVGGAFLLLALVLWWRDRRSALFVTAALGSLLIVAGLLIPKQLGPIYRAWMGFGLALSKITSPIFLGVVYFIIFSPVGWVLRRLHRNPLASRRGATAWRTRPPEARRSALDHQF